MSRPKAAGKVIAYLEEREPGARLSRDEISEKFGVLRNNVSTAMRKAIADGSLEVTAESHTRFYSLPVPATPNDGPLNITTDSAGDLWFTGATLNPDDNSCLLTQSQLQQLVDFATRPVVRRAAAGDAA